MLDKELIKQAIIKYVEECSGLKPKTKAFIAWIMSNIEDIFFHLANNKIGGVTHNMLESFILAANLKYMGIT